MTERKQRDLRERERERRILAFYFRSMKDSAARTCRIRVLSQVELGRFPLACGAEEADLVLPARREAAPSRFVKSAFKKAQHA